VLIAATTVVSSPIRGAHAETNARGVRSGDAHTVRIRPVLATVPAAPRRRVTRSARAAGVAALAMCDPDRPAAVRTAPDASAPADGTGSCVVAPLDDTAGATGRRLLGPAVLSGNDVEQVRVTPKGRARFGLELRLDDSHVQPLVELDGGHDGERFAVTLDGHIVTTFVVGRDGDGEIDTTLGSLWFAPEQGFPARSRERCASSSTTRATNSSSACCAPPR
jgi:hypothetical protein